LQGGTWEINKRKGCQNPGKKRGPIWGRRWGKDNRDRRTGKAILRAKIERKQSKQWKIRRQDGEDGCCALVSEQHIFDHIRPTEKKGVIDGSGEAPRSTVCRLPSIRENRRRGLSLEGGMGEMGRRHVWRGTREGQVLRLTGDYWAGLGTSDQPENNQVQGRNPVVIDQQKTKRNHHGRECNKKRAGSTCLGPNSDSGRAGKECAQGESVRLKKGPKVGAARKKQIGERRTHASTDRAWGTVWGWPKVPRGRETRSDYFPRFGLHSLCGAVMQKFGEKP